MSIFNLDLESRPFGKLSSSYGIRSVQIVPTSIFEDGYEVDMALSLDGFKRMQTNLAEYEELYRLLRAIEADKVLAEQFNEIKTIIKLKND